MSKQEHSVDKLAVTPVDDLISSSRDGRKGIGVFTMVHRLRTIGHAA